jgi:DNA-binding transcriptional ArsR family regulator
MAKTTVQQPRSRISTAVQRASARLKTLADWRRLQILLTLSERGRNAGELLGICKRAPREVVSDLAALRGSGFVLARRAGAITVYLPTALGARFTKRLLATKRIGISAATTMSKTPSPKRSGHTPGPIDSALLDDVGAFVENAQAWFLTPNSFFEDRRPIDLLGTPDEARLRKRIAAAKCGMFT